MNDFPIQNEVPWHRKLRDFFWPTYNLASDEESKNQYRSSHAYAVRMMKNSYVVSYHMRMEFIEEQRASLKRPAQVD